MKCGSAQFHWVIIRLKTCYALWPQEQEYSRIWRITQSGQPLWPFYQQQITRVDTKAITGHQSEACIESYSNTPTFHQFKVMSNAIADFVDSGCSSVDPSASLVAESTGMKAASSSIHSTSASPDESNIQKPLKFNSHKRTATYSSWLDSRRHISRLHFQLYRQSSRKQFPAKYLRLKLHFFLEYRVRSKKPCNSKIIELFKSFASFRFVFPQLITWLIPYHVCLLYTSPSPRDA